MINFTYQEYINQNNKTKGITPNVLRIDGYIPEQDLVRIRLPKAYDINNTDLYDIYYVIDLIITGKISVKNPSVLKNWRGFKTQDTVAVPNQTVFVLEATYGNRNETKQQIIGIYLSCKLAEEMQKKVETYLETKREYTFYTTTISKYRLNNKTFNI